MKHLLRIACIIVVITLVGCTTEPIITEAPSIVLQKAVQAIQNQSNQGYSVIVDYTSKQVNSEVSLALQGQGSLVNNAQQISFNGQLSARGFLNGIPFTALAQLALVQSEDGTTYYNVPSLQLTPAELSEVFSETITINEWQVIESQQTGSSASTLPTMLYPTSFEYVKIIDPESAYDKKKNEYTYTIELLEEETLMYLQTLPESTIAGFDTAELDELFATHAFSGSITIDAQNYSVNSIRWSIVPKQQDASLPVVNILVEFTDSYAPIVLPDITL